MRFKTESCRGVSPFITANKICAEWLEQALEVLYNKEKHSKAISCNKEKGFLNGKKVKNSVLIDLFYEDGLRTGERSGEKKGIQKGMQEKEIALIVKKVRRGKNLQTIADELEEPVDEVRKIYEAVMKAAPDYDIKMIRESLA